MPTINTCIAVNTERTFSLIKAFRLTPASKTATFIH